MLTVKELPNLAGKKVYVRVDFNVPHKGDVISDDNRIRAAIPTLAKLLEQGARVLIMSHLGKVEWKKLKKGEKETVVEVVGMFQKEVAERVCAKSGNKQYGILSVLLQAFYDTEYLFTVGEHEFTPPPQVKSAVIRLTRNFDKKLHCDEKTFRTVVKTAFNYRRKTLRNALQSLPFDKAFVEGEPLFTKRAEQLSLQDFEYLCGHIR